LAHYQNKRIDIILPWRIGDTILNIPMLVCLKQLNEKYNNKIKIIAQPLLLLTDGLKIITLEIRKNQRIFYAKIKKKYHS